MKRAAWVMVAIVAAGASCACKGSKGGGTGPGTGGGSGGEPAACDAQREHVRGLYQAAGGLSDVEVADNVAMVIKECRAAPDRVVACLARVTAVVELERACLPALDDEGRDGHVFLAR
jgi:hypothetical protein